MNTPVDEVPTWNKLPQVVRLASEGGCADFDRATSFFRELKRLERLKAPVLGLWCGHVAASEASLGALNIYLGTVGVAGLARRLGVQGCRTRYDLQGLLSLIGYASNERQSVQRSA